MMDKKYSKRGLKFFDIDDEVFRGKGWSALRKSREKRAAIIALFGGRENIPSSVMRASKARPTEDFDLPVAGSRRYLHTNTPLVKEMRGSVKHAFRLSGAGVHAGALSTFPQNVGRSVLLLYSDPGDLVLDPFAGHNSRLELCVKNGRHYTGYDISSEFMSFNETKAKQLRSSLPSASIHLHLQDSRKLKFTPTDSADFTVTSPPYYDIEYYGSEEAQLGKLKTYGDFLLGLGAVLKENFRGLKSGSFAVWFVNDFRRKKKFYTYHADVICLAVDAGFHIHDIIIVDFGTGIRDVFINQAIEQRIIPKRHEYALVFRKP